MNELQTLLRVRNLQVRFPLRSGVFGRMTSQVQAVRGVDLDLRPGEFLGLVGESGCGKSTVAHALCGLVPWYKGELWLEKELLPSSEKDWRWLRKSVQMVFQDPQGSLNPRRTVEETLSDPLRAMGMRRGVEMRREVFRLLDLVGLPADSAVRFPHAFSGGQRQRIGIARALAIKPRILICDEPTSALDVSVQAQILHLLRNLGRELGLSLLFISHDLGVVEALCDRVSVMYASLIVEEAPVEQIFSNPQHPYTRALHSSVPVVGSAHRPQALAGEVPSALQQLESCPFAGRCGYKEDRCMKELPPLEKKGAGYLRCPVVERAC